MTDSSAESDSKAQGPSDDVPGWLSAASLTPDAILTLCDSWLENAGPRATDSMELGDSEWIELCEKIRVVASGMKMDVRPIMEFEQACPQFGMPAQEDVFTKLRTAMAVVESLADSAKYEVSQRLSQPAEPTSKVPAGELDTEKDSSNTERKKTKREKQQEWLANAMLLLRDHPDWSDAKIAREVGKSPSTLCRNPEYKAAAARSRGSKSNIVKGHKTVDSESGMTDVEAYASDAENCDLDSDIGQPIPGSKFVREKCSTCGEPMRVSPDDVGTFPVCGECQE